MKERRHRVVLAFATTSGAAMVIRRVPKDLEVASASPNRPRRRRRVSEPPTVAAKRQRG